MKSHVLILNAPLKSVCVGGGGGGIQIPAV